MWQLIAKLTLVLDLNFEMKLSMQDCCERIKVKCFKNMTFFFFFKNTSGCGIYA